MISEDQCSKQMQHEHVMKLRVVKHHFNDWQDAHALSQQNIRYTFTRSGYVYKDDI